MQFVFLESHSTYIEAWESIMFHDSVLYDSVGTGNGQAVQLINWSLWNGWWCQSHGIGVLLAQILITQQFFSSSD
jgi:hypothetical protein